MTAPVLRRLAAGSLGLNALLHLILAPEYLAQKALHRRLVRGPRGDQRLGRRACSLRRSPGLDDRRAGQRRGLPRLHRNRTTGLQGFHPTDWEFVALMTRVLEAIVVACYLGGTPSRARAGGRPR